MGKGDIKTKRGKIANNSFGARRKRKPEKAVTKPVVVAKTVAVKKPVVIEKPVEVVEKKAAPKKTTKKPKGEEAAS
jgi:30S ribosomal protein S31